MRPSTPVLLGTTKHTKHHHHPTASAHVSTNLLSAWTVRQLLRKPGEGPPIKIREDSTQPCSQGFHNQWISSMKYLIGMRIGNQVSGTCAPSTTKRTLSHQLTVKICDYCNHHIDLQNPNETELNISSENKICVYKTKSYVFSNHNIQRKAYIRTSKYWKIYCNKSKGCWVTRWWFQPPLEIFARQNGFIFPNLPQFSGWNHHPNAIGGSRLDGGTAPAPCLS